MQARILRRTVANGDIQTISTIYVYPEGYIRTGRDVLHWENGETEICRDIEVRWFGTDSGFVSPAKLTNRRFSCKKECLDMLPNLGFTQRDGEKIPFWVRAFYEYAKDNRY